MVPTETTGITMVQTEGLTTTTTGTLKTAIATIMEEITIAGPNVHTMEVKETAGKTGASNQ